MSTPELDPRFDDLVRELRTLPRAPEALRARVLGLAEAPPAPPRRRRTGRLVLVAACVALLGIAGVAAVYGIVSSGGGGQREQAAGTVSAGAGGGSAGAVRAAPKAHRTLTTETQVAGSFASPTALPPPSATALDSAATLPPTQGRLQQYSATMRLRVKGVDGLSRTTNRAMRITRSLGGFVASVDYGTPSRKSGEAYLTVRIPNARVQQAVVRFSSLGVILSQDISIRDLQDQANHEAVQIIRLQREIDRLVAKLRGSLSPEERVQTQSQLDAARAALRARTEQHAGTVRRGRLATFTLELTTRKAAVVPVHHGKGRVGRAASHAFGLLAKIVAGTIYGAIVLLPLLVLGVLLLVASRLLRRRGNERLLARA
jgi:Domain of unknown function (DUF4349)